MGQESRACGPAPTRRRAWIKSKNGSAASPRMMLLARRVICSRRVASIHIKVDGPTRLRSCRTAWAAASAHISGKERPRRPALNVRKRTERVRPADSEIVSSWNRGGCRGVLAAWLGIPLHDATAWTRRAIHLALYCAVGACFALGFYFVMQPSRTPNPGLAAYRPPPATVMTMSVPSLPKPPLARHLALRRRPSGSPRRRKARPMGSPQRARAKQSLRSAGQTGEAKTPAHGCEQAAP